MKSKLLSVCLGLCRVAGLGRPLPADSGDPDLIFRKSTTFKLLTPNDKLAVYGVDDPAIEGVACHYTAPEKGGLAGAFGLAEQTSDMSLACRQYGADQVQGEIRSGRRGLPRAAVVVLQEDADRARLRRQAQHIDLYGLYRQTGRRFAKELDIERSDSTLGRGGRRRSKMRGFRSLTSALASDAPVQRASANLVAAANE